MASTEDRNARRDQDRADAARATEQRRAERLGAVERSLYRQAMAAQAREDPSAAQVDAHFDEKVEELFGASRQEIMRAFERDQFDDARLNAALGGIRSARGKWTRAGRRRAYDKVLRNLAAHQGRYRRAMKGKVKKKWWW